MRQPTNPNPKPEPNKKEMHPDSFGTKAAKISQRRIVKTLRVEAGSSKKSPILSILPLSPFSLFLSPLE
jgi:hypothetical protein